MGGAGYSRADLLEFNEVQLGAMIEIIEDVRDKMVVSKSSYDDYITNSLAPGWTTENGLKTVSDLRIFSNENIQQFITYIDNRIMELKSVLEEVKRINVA